VPPGVLDDDGRPEQRHHREDLDRSERADADDDNERSTLTRDRLPGWWRVSLSSANVARGSINPTGQTSAPTRVQAAKRNWAMAVSNMLRDLPSLAGGAEERRVRAREYAPVPTPELVARPGCSSPPGRWRGVGLVEAHAEADGGQRRQGVAHAANGHLDHL